MKPKTISLPSNLFFVIQVTVVSLGILGIFLLIKVFTESYYDDWQEQELVAAPQLPEAITTSGTPFDFCTMGENVGLAYQAHAGTPVPPVPLVVNTPIAEVPTEEQKNGILPIDQATPVPEIKPTSSQSEVVFVYKPDIVKPQNFSDENYHILIIGVGYSELKNKEIIGGKIGEIQSAFNGVNVDFAYAKNSVSIDLRHIEQQADFENYSQIETLMVQIKSFYPEDGVFFIVNSDEFVGNTVISASYSIAFASGNFDNLTDVIIHETAHELGLSDGYREYLADQIPGSELFYADAMPKYLVEALDELGYFPPLYEVGVCKGRKVYSFYEDSNNVMRDFNPQGPNSWGESVFTPLQTIIMNNYVETFKN